MRNMDMIAAGLTLAACGRETTPPVANEGTDVAITEDDSEPDNSTIENAATITAWPSSLAPFGDGYPKAGDPCRRVGESAATSDYLDDSADLVGCPSAEAAAKLGGKVVATIENITLVSVPSAH